MTRAEMIAHARAMARKYGVDEDVFLRQGQRESDWNADIVNPKSGAMGVYQFRPATAAEWGLDDPFDAGANIETAAKYDAYLLRYFKGDYRKAIGAFNWGMGNVGKKGIAAAPTETIEYLDFILGKESIVLKPGETVRIVL